MKIHVRKCGRYKTAMQYWSAWAIDSRSEEGHGLLGIWFINHTLRPDPCQLGNTIALFKTRKQARKWLRKDKQLKYQAFPKMRVVKVKVTVETR